MLLDTYGIRKDDFDRVANEEMYLRTMGAARNDKTRLLSYVSEARARHGWKSGRLTEACSSISLKKVKTKIGIERLVGVEASAEELSGNLNKP